MLPNTLRDLHLAPYLNLAATLASAFGVLVGVIGFLASLGGTDVFIRLLPVLQVDGLAAGVLGLLVMPVAFAFVGLLIGLATYLPFRFLMRLLVLVDRSFRRAAPAPRAVDGPPPQENS